MQNQSNSAKNNAQNNSQNNAQNNSQNNAQNNSQNKTQSKKGNHATSSSAPGFPDADRDRASSGPAAGHGKSQG